METSCPGPVKDRNTVINLEMSSGLAKGTLGSRVLLTDPQSSLEVFGVRKI